MKDPVLMVILLILLIQLVQGLHNRQRFRVFDLVGGENENVIEGLMDTYALMQQFGVDINTIQNYLLLEPTQYESLGFGGVESTGTAEEDTTTQLYSFVAELGSYEKRSEIYETNKAALELWLEDSIWSEHSLLVQEPVWDEDQYATRYSLTHPLGYTPLEFYLKEDGDFYYHWFSDALEMDEELTFSDYQAQLQAALEQELPLLNEYLEELELQRQNLANLTQLEAVNATLNSSLLSWSKEERLDNAFVYELLTSDQVKAAELRFEYKIPALLVSNDKEEVLGIDSSFVFDIRMIKQMDSDNPIIFAASYEELQTELAQWIESSVDARTQIQKKVDTQRYQLESAMLEEAFQVTLEQEGIVLGKAYEDELGIHYPFLNQEGDLLRTLILDKTTAEIRVVHPESQEAESLSSAIEGLRAPLGKKKLWIYPSLYLSIKA